MIIASLVIHVLGLSLISMRVVRVLSRESLGRRRVVADVLVMVTAILLVTALHGLEGAAWAYAYWLLGAVPDFRAAMLYSLSAITAYGHAQLFLVGQWQMMGALEALNGLMLFGLTTAFLFAMIDDARSIRRGRRPR